MGAEVKSKVVSQAAIQRAKFANAFDTLCHHYAIDMREYQREKFEIGCEMADYICPGMSKNARFWQYWNFLWNMESLWIAQNLKDVGHVDYYALMRTAKDNEAFIDNILNYVNRGHESELK